MLAADMEPIGIIIKHTYPDKHVEMVDVNPRAIALAKENAKANHVDVQIHESDVYAQVTGNTYTDILTNPPIRAGKKVIYEIFEKLMIIYVKAAAYGLLFVNNRAQIVQ